MNYAVSEITHLPVSQDQLEHFKSQIIEEIKAGVIPPATAKIIARAMKEVADCIDKEEYVIASLINDIDTNGKLQIEGYELSVGERKTPDWSCVNDRELSELEEEVKNATQRLDARKKYILSLPETDHSTGEIYDKPEFKVNRFLIVKLKK